MSTLEIVNELNEAPSSNTKQLPSESVSPLSTESNLIDEQDGSLDNLEFKGSLEKIPPTRRSFARFNIEESQENGVEHVETLGNEARIPPTVRFKEPSEHPSASMTNLSQGSGSKWSSGEDEKLGSLLSMSELDLAAAGQGNGANGTRRRGSKIYPVAGMDAAVFGDYDLARSPSTASLVLHYLDDTNLKRTRTKRDAIFLPHDNDGKVAGPLFKSVFKHYEEGVNTILDDNFWKCFKKKKILNWNFNVYLFPTWVIGTMFRWFVLLPIRLSVFILSFALYFLGMLIVHSLYGTSSEKDAAKAARRKKWEIRLIQAMCGVFFFAWGAVVKYHGFVPKENVTAKGARVNPVFVANHSTMVDAIILLQIHAFSLVGQKHKGFAGFLQDKAIACLQCVWFNRGEAKDRQVVSDTLVQHSHDVTKNPLLVFPEGTCVNNEYCIQFKKGVFELGVPVCPVAIKYQKVFVDPFWSSKDQSFPMHILELMSSWALICDVYFLEPMERGEDEDAAEFAARVKAKISKKAELIDVDFDGYMKHWKPSQRYVKARQTRFTNALKRIFYDFDMANRVKEVNERDGYQSYGRKGKISNGEVEIDRGLHVEGGMFDIGHGDGDVTSPDVSPQFIKVPLKKQS